MLGEVIFVAVTLVAVKLVIIAVIALRVIDDKVAMVDAAAVSKVLIVMLEVVILVLVKLVIVALVEFKVPVVKLVSNASISALIFIPSTIRFFPVGMLRLLSIVVASVPALYEIPVNAVEFEFVEVVREVTAVFKSDNVVFTLVVPSNKFLPAEIVKLLSINVVSVPLV